MFILGRPKVMEVTFGVILLFIFKKGEGNVVWSDVLVFLKKF